QGVAVQARAFVCITDDTKLVDKLGAFALPIEIIPFAHTATMDRINRAITALPEYKAVPPVKIRCNNGQHVISDNGNIIIDLSVGHIVDARALAQLLAAIPGVVDHGLFIDIADHAIIGYANGEIRHYQHDCSFGKNMLMGA
ncbi:MAG: ribose-5-phosphate isomerase A, partial [Pseudomonadota bacterium]